MEYYHWTVDSRIAIVSSKNSRAISDLMNRLFLASLFWIWINIIDQKAIETKLTQKKEQPIDFILYPMPESRKRAINHSNKNEHINDLNVWNGAALLVADCMGTGVSKK